MASDKCQMGGGGKAVSRGQVLLVRSSTTSSSRRQCDGGGRSGLFSDSDSFYQLCQLSALPASILGLSEQTKTGATRGRGRQSRRKPMPQAVLAGEAHPQRRETIQLVFWFHCIVSYFAKVGKQPAKLEKSRLQQTNRARTVHSEQRRMYKMKI